LFVRLIFENMISEYAFTCHTVGHEVESFLSWCATATGGLQVMDDMMFRVEVGDERSCASHSGDDGYYEVVGSGSVASNKED